MIIAISLFSQNAGNNPISNIKNYKTLKLENELTLVSLQNNDTINTFIRLYTDLPEYVNEDFSAVHDVNKVIQKN